MLAGLLETPQEHSQLFELFQNPRFVQVQSLRHPLLYFNEKKLTTRQKAAKATPSRLHPNSVNSGFLEAAAKHIGDMLNSDECFWIDFLDDSLASSSLMTT